MMPSHRGTLPVAICVAVAGISSVAGVAGSTRVAIAVAIAVTLTAVVALFLDPVSGAMVALGTSSALILGRRVIGPWGEDEFWLALLQTVGLFSTGAAAGRAGRELRRSERFVEDAPSLLPEPVFGSLGLLDADVALARLEEEVERAVRHRRPLCIVLIDVKVDEPLSAHGTRNARRAVCRIFESRLRATDVPFALAEDRLGAILPETNVGAAWERVGAILDGIGDGRFRVRDGSVDGLLGDVVHLEVGVAELRESTPSADALLDAVTTALRRPTGEKRP